MRRWTLADQVEARYYFETTMVEDCFVEFVVPFVILSLTVALCAVNCGVCVCGFAPLINLFPKAKLLPLCNTSIQRLPPPQNDVSYLKMRNIKNNRIDTPN